MTRNERENLKKSIAYDLIQIVDEAEEQKENKAFTADEIKAMIYAYVEKESPTEMRGQTQFIAWLITAATDKCQSVEELRATNERIRQQLLTLTDT